jgi:pimeloyl-ACP methyl ester carboxylesterase
MVVARARPCPRSARPAEIEADDLARLVDAVGCGSADVFASSGGAVAGLALAVRSPERVRVLVAQEPPVTELLPDAEHVRTVVDDIEGGYRDGGNGPAWTKFVLLVMHNGLVTADGVPPAA